MALFENKTKPAGAYQNSGESEAEVAKVFAPAGSNDNPHENEARQPLLTLRPREIVLDRAVFHVFENGQKVADENFAVTSRWKTNFFGAKSIDHRQVIDVVQLGQTSRIKTECDFDRRQGATSLTAKCVLGNEGSDARFDVLYEQSKKRARIVVKRPNYPIDLNLRPHPNRLVAIQPGLSQYGLMVRRFDKKSKYIQTFDWVTYGAEKEGFSINYSRFDGDLLTQVDVELADSEYLEVDGYRFEEYPVRSGQVDEAYSRIWHVWTDSEGNLLKMMVDDIENGDSKVLQRADCPPEILAFEPSN